MEVGSLAPRAGRRAADIMEDPFAKKIMSCLSVNDDFFSIAQNYEKFVTGRELTTTALVVIPVLLIFRPLGDDGAGQFCAGVLCRAQGI
jgi:hypothetical protein